MMDARDSEKAKTVDLLGSLEGKELLSSQQPSLKRELDSIDDFEHLEHDISPLKEVAKVSPEHDHTTREFLEKINKGVADSVGNVASKLADDASNFDPLRKDGLFDKTASAVAMDSNLLELANTFPDRKEADAKLDKFLSEISSISPGPTEKQLKENIKEKIEDVKSASQNFMDMERGPVFHHDPSPVISSTHDIIERFTDSEPEDDFKPSKEDLSKIKDNDNVKTDMFKDFDDFELPKASAPTLEPQKVQEVKINENVKIPEVPAPKQPPLEPMVVKELPVKVPEPMKPEPIAAPVKEPVKIETSKPVIEPVSKKDLDIKKKPDIPIKIESKPKTQAEAMFCKMGLDAWFIPEKLNPRVADLIYWRDPKKSGPVFGGVLIVLLALTYFSLISVVAYLSLLALTGTISFRIYKNVVQAVQKTGDGHPFKELLDTDFSLPQEKVEEISKIGVAHFNAAIVELRRLFLVEDLVDSIKFGVLLWCLTYLGAWFNGMTLIIIAWVALFTLPKVYETNKTQIDANLDIVRNKLEEITSKVKAAIPIGKKVEEKKQQ